MSLGQPIARLLSERPWILAIAGASVAALLLYEAWRQGEDYGPFLEGAERTAVVERLVNEPGGMRSKNAMSSAMSSYVSIEERIDADDPIPRDRSDLPAPIRAVLPVSAWFRRRASDIGLKFYGCL